MSRIVEHTSADKSNYFIDLRTLRDLFDLLPRRACGDFDSGDIE